MDILDMHSFVSGCLLLSSQFLRWLRSHALTMRASAHAFRIVVMSSPMTLLAIPVITYWLTGAQRTSALSFNRMICLSMHYRMFVCYVPTVPLEHSTRIIRLWSISIPPLSHLNAVDSLLWILFSPMYSCVTTHIAHLSFRFGPHSIIALVWFLSIYTFTFCITSSFMLHPFSSLSHLSKPQPFFSYIEMQHSLHSPVMSSKK